MGQNNVYLVFYREHFFPSVFDTFFTMSQDVWWCWWWWRWLWRQERNKDCDSWWKTRLIKKVFLCGFPIFYVFSSFSQQPGNADRLEVEFCGLTQERLGAVASSRRLYTRRLRYFLLMCFLRRDHNTNCVFFSFHFNAILHAKDRVIVTLFFGSASISTVDGNSERTEHINENAAVIFLRVRVTR